MCKLMLKTNLTTIWISLDQEIESQLSYGLQKIMICVCAKKQKLNLVKQDARSMDCPKSSSIKDKNYKEIETEMIGFHYLLENTT